MAWALALVTFNRLQMWRRERRGEESGAVRPADPESEREGPLAPGPHRGHD